MDWNLEFDPVRIFACSDIKVKPSVRNRAILRLISAAKTTADVALVNGHLPEACQHYTRAISAGIGRLSPSKLSVLYSNRSAAWVELGQYAQACGDAEAALTLRPNWSQVRSIPSPHYRKMRRRFGAVASISADSAISLRVDPRPLAGRFLKFPNPSTPTRCIRCICLFTNHNIKPVSSSCLVKPSAT